MESLNLNTLASSLPSGHQNAEKELSNNFKAAALSITTLYRSSRQASKRAYNAGYSSACQDLLTMIQHTVSIGGIDSSSSGTASGSGSEAMTIGKVMDWVEARLEAIKSREEEEDEDDEKEREKEQRRSTVPPVAPATSHKQDKVHAPSTSARIQRDNAPSLPTPSSPHQAPSQPLSHPPSPSPQPSAVNALRQTTRPIKPRPSTHSRGDAPSQSHDHQPTLDFASDPMSPSSVPMAISPLTDSHMGGPMAGAKRRHAVMMMLDSTSASPVHINGSSSGSPLHSESSPHAGASSLYSSTLGAPRRRTRSSRGGGGHLQQIQLQHEDMDVEEDGGRERKRVARR